MQVSQFCSVVCLLVCLLCCYFQKSEKQIVRNSFIFLIWRRNWLAKYPHYYVLLNVRLLKKSTILKIIINFNQNIVTVTKQKLCFINIAEFELSSLQNINDDTSKRCASLNHIYVSHDDSDGSESEPAGSSLFNPAVLKFGEASALPIILCGLLENEFFYEQTKAFMSRGRNSLSSAY